MNFFNNKQRQVRHVHPTAEAPTPAPVTTTTKSEIVENKMQQIEQQACLIDWMNFKNKKQKQKGQPLSSGCIYIYLTIILKTFRIIKQKQQYLPLLSSL